MHKWAKGLVECLKSEVEGIGKDNLTGDQICEITKWSEFAKNVVCMEKDFLIIEAMKKAEDEEQIMEMVERYTEYPERKYYNTRRYKNGEYAPKGAGHYVGMHGYSEPYIYDEAERMRDMDLDKGRRYYTDMGSMHDSRMGRSGMSRRTYMEYTEMHNSNNQHEKDERAKLRKEHIKDLKEDLKEMMASIPQDEKQAFKSELNMMMQEF